MNIFFLYVCLLLSAILKYFVVCLQAVPLRLNANSTGHVNSPETIIIGRKTAQSKSQSIPKTRKGRKSIQPMNNKIQTANEYFDGVSELFKTPYQEVRQNESGKLGSAPRRSSTRVRFSTVKHMSPDIPVRSQDLVNISGIKAIKTPPSVLKRSSRLNIGTPFPDVTERSTKSPESPLAKELDSSNSEIIKIPQLLIRRVSDKILSETFDHSNQEITSIFPGNTPKSAIKSKPVSLHKKISSLRDSDRSFNSGRQSKNVSVLNASGTDLSGKKIVVQDVTMNSTFSPLSIISGNNFTSITTSEKKSSENALRVIFSDYDVNSGSSNLVDKSVSSVNKRKQRSHGSKTSVTPENLELFITDGTSQKSRRKTRSVLSENLSKSRLSVHSNANTQNISDTIFSSRLGSSEDESLNISVNLSVSRRSSKRRSQSSVASSKQNNSKLLTPDERVAETRSQSSYNRNSKDRFAVSTPKDMIAHKSSRKSSSLSNSGTGESQIGQNIAYGSGRKLRNSSFSKTQNSDLSVSKSSRKSETAWKTYELPTDTTDLNSSKNFDNIVSNKESLIHQIPKETSSSKKNKSTSKQKSLSDISSSSSKHENRATPNVPEELFVSPILALRRQSVRNDLRNVAGVKRIMSPLSNSPASSYVNVHGIKRLIKTPRKSSEHVGVSEIKNLFVTSPVADYTDVKGVKRLLTTPKSPQIGYTNVDGIKKLFDRNVPASDYTDVMGIKQICRKRSPKSSYLDVTGVRRIFKEDRSPQSPMLVGVECLFESPKSISVDKVVQEPSTSDEKRISSEVSSSLKKTEPSKKSASPAAKRRKIVYNKSQVSVQEDSSRRPTRRRQAYVQEAENLFESSGDNLVQKPSVSRRKVNTPEVDRAVEKRTNEHVKLTPKISKQKLFNEGEDYKIIQDLIHEDSRRKTRTRQTNIKEVKTGKNKKTENNRLDRDTVVHKEKRGRKPKQRSDTSSSPDKKNKKLAQDSEPAETVVKGQNRLSSKKDQEMSGIRSQSISKLSTPTNKKHSRKRKSDTTSEETDVSATVFPEDKRRKVENVSSAKTEQVSNKISTRKRGGDISKNKTNKVEQIIHETADAESKSTEITGIRTRNKVNLIGKGVIVSTKTIRKTRNQVSGDVNSDTVLSGNETFTDITKETKGRVVKINVSKDIKEVKKRKEDNIQLEVADHKHTEVIRKTRTAVRNENLKSPDRTKSTSRKNTREAKLSSGNKENAKHIDANKVPTEALKAKKIDSDIKLQKSKETINARSRQGRSVEKNSSPVLKKRTRNQLLETGNETKDVLISGKDTSSGGTEKTVSPKKKRNTRKTTKDSGIILQEGTDIKVSPKIRKTRNKNLSEGIQKSNAQNEEIEKEYDNNITNIVSTRTRRKQQQTNNVDSAVSTKIDDTAEVIVSINIPRNKNKGKENLSESTPDLVRSLKFKNSEQSASPPKKTKENKAVKFVNEVVETVRPRRNLQHSEDMGKSTRKSVLSGTSQKKVQFNT